MSEKTEYELSTHAAMVMAEREIPEEWVARVPSNPERAARDASDPALLHALGRIPERDDRVLRVVYNETTHPYRIVTAYFDRAMRDQR